MIIVAETKKHTKLPRLLRKALELFVEKGIEATTTKDIAHRARVAEGTIYRHFKSKNDMAWYLFHTNLTELTSHLFRLVETTPGAKARLEKTIACFFDYYEQDQVLFNFILLSQHQELRQYTDMDQTPYHVLLRILNDGMKQGEIREVDSTLYAAMLLGMVGKVAESKAYGRLNKDLRKLAAPVADACWRVLSA